MTLASVQNCFHFYELSSSKKLIVIKMRREVASEGCHFAFTQGRSPEASKMAACQLFRSEKDAD